MIQVNFTMLHEDAREPFQAYSGDAGWDLTLVEKVEIPPGEGVDCKTGIAIAMPEDHYGRIVGRSSAMRKKGVLVIEGIIDCGFRGELFSYAFNPGDETIYLAVGESIAQIIVSPVPSIMWVRSKELAYSERGQNGFGSSGR